MHWHSHEKMISTMHFYEKSTKTLIETSFNSFFISTLNIKMTKKMDLGHSSSVVYLIGSCLGSIPEWSPPYSSIIMYAHIIHSTICNSAISPPWGLYNLIMCQYRHSPFSLSLFFLFWLTDGRSGRLSRRQAEGFRRCLVHLATPRRHRDSWIGSCGGTVARKACDWCSSPLGRKPKCEVWNEMKWNAICICLDSLWNKGGMCINDTVTLQTGKINHLYIDLAVPLVEVPSRIHCVAKSFQIRIWKDELHKKLGWGI